MSFPVQQFVKFCKYLKIDTKEEGLRTLYPFFNTQKIFIRGVARGIEEGKHWFTVLKPRQVGMSAITCALDLFWPMRYPGLSGGIVVQDDPTRDQFRTNFDLYLKNLPREWRFTPKSHNRNQMVFPNGSRLQYAVAGTKKKGGGLGKAKSLVFLHASEVSAWGDEKGVASLKATLAETNPKRLFVWESTAEGFNHFKDMWDESVDSVTQQAIFIGWFHHDLYRVPKDSEVFKAYWGAHGMPTAWERQTARQVKALYDFEITAEQWAWYRWKLKEDQGDDLIMKQNYPSTAEEAFVVTGSQFFSGAILTELEKQARSAEGCSYMRVNFTGEFKDTTAAEVLPRHATLRVWEKPDREGHYVLGCDPAYGSSEWADSFCIGVFRCYSNRIVQVAEFADYQCDTMAFAWVMAYLAGAYEKSTVILEINGPGEAVMNELKNLRSMRHIHPSDRKGMANVMKNVQQYIYRRGDSLGGSGVLHFQSQYKTKNLIMNQLKDYTHRRMVTIRSHGLIEEMKSIVQEPGDAPSSQGRDKDDRVMAAALAVHAWDRTIRAHLIARGHAYVENPETGARHVATPAERVLQNYLTQMGFPRG